MPVTYSTDRAVRRSIEGGPDMSAPFDLTYRDAQRRIADLQAVASTTHVEAATPTRSGSPVVRLRHALGSRLIDLGAALIADQPRRA